MLQELLGFHSIVADTAADGAEALEKLRTTKYDGALIDLQLPKITGMELIRRIRDSRDYHHMFLMIVSGQPAPLADRDFVAAHTEATVMKPYDLEKLVGIIENAASLRKARCSP